MVATIKYRVEAKLSSADEQLFDEAITDFDIVSPAWDNEVDALADFDSVTDADGDLINSTYAAHDGTYGLQVAFDDVNAAYGTMNLGAVNQTSLMVSFWFSKNTVAIEDGKVLYFLRAADGAANYQLMVQLKNDGGDFELTLYARNDATGWDEVAQIPAVTAGYHKYDIWWKRSTGADDGICRLYQDDILIGSKTDCDNDTLDIDYIRIGMNWTNSTTFGGSFIFDSVKIDPIGAPYADKLSVKNGYRGMTIPTMDNTARRAEFTDLDDETVVMAECWFNPKSITMADGDSFIIISANPDLEWEVMLKYTVADGYQINANVCRDVGVSSTSWYSITDDWHHIRIYWRASGGDGDDNGSFHLFIDYVLQEALTGLDNDTITVNWIYFGAVGDLDDTTYGIFYMDDCRWGPWADITSDVLQKSWGHSRGTNGNRPNNRTASPGKFTFYLLNTAQNSGGLAGYYSPDHANILSGFCHGTEIRISYIYDAAAYYRWRGRIYSIAPDPSPYGALTKVVCYDWMKEAEIQKFKAVTTATDQRGDQAITTVLAILPSARQPEATSLETGKSTFPYVFDTERTEKTGVLAILQKTALTELGRVYVNSQGGNGEQLVFENRHHAVDETTVQFDFDDHISDIEAAYPTDLLYTRVITRAYPRESSTGIVLGSIRKSFSITSSDSRTVEILFRDPETGERISASDAITPLEATTDYLGNSAEGGGSNLTANVTATVAEESANSLKVTMSYSGAGVCWITKLQVRGDGLLRYDPATYETEDETCQGLYGDRLLRYDMPYEDDFNVAASFGDYLLELYKNPVLYLSGLTYYPERSTGTADAFMAIDLGHRITVNITQLGIDQDYFVIKKTDSLYKGKIRCTYGLAPTGSNVFMQLNDAIYAKLDVDECKLAV